jgi:hypothetical protein
VELFKETQTKKLEFVDNQATQKFFKNMDSTGWRLFNKNQSIVECLGTSCSSFSWISGMEAFHSFILFRFPQFQNEWMDLWLWVSIEPQSRFEEQDKVENHEESMISKRFESESEKQ